jgi:hypothetical protein
MVPGRRRERHIDALEEEQVRRGQSSAVLRHEHSATPIPSASAEIGMTRVVVVKYKLVKRRARVVRRSPDSFTQ